MSAEQTVHVIRITLAKTRPPIWRKVAVPSNITLGQLHMVIQIVMGWEDEHLHDFVLRDKSMVPSREEYSRLLASGQFDLAMFGRMRGQRSFVPIVRPTGRQLIWTVKMKTSSPSAKSVRL